MKAVTLPRWLERSATPRYDNLYVVTVFTLVLRIHGTAAAVRNAARHMRDKVRVEHRQKMANLAQTPSDDQVLRTANAIVQDGTDAMGILPGQPFEQRLQDAPRCHYKSMHLAGEPGARHWKCQHCQHTKPINWRAAG
ncbi:hypothetical protein SAMN05216588_101259 [Pseudomonas flavescens]|uniref:DUF7740 domain-containing protein n=1 Tax=Phytopseudomonas flavescens TaxID=29435 RepID=A0A1G7XSN0_9GAMM|nr:hypothetical protein [Pseudomonas flavescens]SDG87232.1 hypothetical protein SAMN05216588_101259 [Pseudomonas flavescens]